MDQQQLLAHCGTNKITRDELKLVPTPEGTESHHPLAHHVIAEALIETLEFRHIAVVRDEYAVSKDGMKLFGVMDLETEFDGCRFSLGLRNSNDKSMRLAMTVGYRVLVCDNMAFYGDFTPVLAKHSKHFNLIDTLSVGVDRMQRNFEPMKRQVVAWKENQLPDDKAKLIIYKAFVQGELDAPKYLASLVHDHYFEPKEGHQLPPRSLWGLSNVFTGLFKQLEPIPQFKATAKLGPFLTNYPQLSSDAGPDISASSRVSS